MTSDTWIWIDGGVVPAAEARVPVLDRGFLYGDSVFEVTRTVDKQPLFFVEHLERLERSAAAMGYELPSRESITAATAQALSRVEAAEAYLRIIVTRGAGPLDLDTRELDIRAVVDAEGKPLPFQLAPPEPILGSRLRVELPKGLRQLTVRYRTSPQASALQWLTPSTDDEICRAGGEGRGVIVAPIAFVSEHVETLVELDHEYAELARQVGATPYLRARTPGVREAFIESLAGAALSSLDRSGGVAPYGPWRCPAGHAKCALKAEGALF